MPPKCLLFHKWSEWEEYEKKEFVNTWIVNLGIATQVKVPVTYKKRTCLRCGKVEDREY